MILYKNGLALLGDKLVKNDIVANHGKIIEISTEIVPDEQTEVVDCTNRYILPALVDIHTHGANGYDFNTADTDGMKKILDFYIAHGVGTVFPTVMTDDEERICHQLELIVQLAKDYPEIKGIHLEGPFLSEKFCGAMPVQHLRNPSADLFFKFQKHANGMIKLLPLRPNCPKRWNLSAKFPTQAWWCRWDTAVQTAKRYKRPSRRGQSLSRIGATLCRNLTDTTSTWQGAQCFPTTSAK